MKTSKTVNNNLIIRKHSSVLSSIRRFIILIALWVGTFYIVYINICFLLNIYSDNLVSEYLVLNLSLHLYKVLGLLLVIVTILISIIGTLHIKNLQRRAKQREKDNA
ncbi:hypothetical protein [Pediococcus claussenii]|uniref:hypothetical protein n=1 Tax=Pediococcus claussenii TaxID=187452 RepID=UPI0005A1F266|nr:hypothetical protein [Pediococcus claussenii]ANZ69317.1 hypothetical protein AYR57_02920 [Pediococcus claussenii]ANZ71137.1 hypothetical protein AYR58_02935 [Pediococcus claussenii]